MSYHAGTRLSLHPRKMVFNALPKENQHHLISQFDNRFGVTSLGTSQIHSKVAKAGITTVPTIWASIKPG